MPVAPFAVRRLIPPGSNDPRIVATQVILHVAVSEGPSLYDYFRNRSGGIESHFYIRRDGTIEQYRDTDFEADANHTANQRAISIETQGMGDGEWTPAQLDAIKRLLMWAHDQHGIPLRPCPAHDQPGIGYHVMFGAPGPWTPYVKSCPGPDRVKQFQTDLVPWMNRGAQTTEDPMPTADEIAEALARTEFPTFDKTKDGENIPRRFDVILAQTHFRAQGARAAAAAALQGQNELAKLIRTLPGAGEDLRALADDIVARTAAEVDRLDAEAVAERLEITPKEKP